jgi:hypothetical protein
LAARSIRLRKIELAAKTESGLYFQLARPAQNNNENGAPMRLSRLALAFALTSSCAFAQTNLYWGDVHLHSNISTDAYATGNRTVTPDMSYRFARGLPIVHPTLDTKVQIDRPLDFLAVTDHDINMGIDTMILEEHPLLQASARGRELLAAAKGVDPWPGFMRYRAPDGNTEELQAQVYTPEIRLSAWQREIDAAERNYIPGTFTTFFGWEWTSAPEGKNLHRVVLSNATAETANDFYPYGTNDSPRPEDLWSWLDSTAQRVGIDFVAIPHNSNISGGLMFSETDTEGRPIDAAYARTRMRWEPLMEITQTKGTSEVNPAFAPDDEFAEFEIRRKLLIGTPTPANEADYARSALLRGLAIQQRTGENPYRFGFAGSTDNHIGMTSVEEDNFYGKLANDAKLTQRMPSERPIIFPAWEMSASGLTAVWAEANTREAIFAAFKRKEVYGTTGPRMALRVFGGFDFAPGDAQVNDIAAVGYAKGIPMGGDLSTAPAGKSLTLLIHAAKDPIGANLDRVQVVKGWLDANGSPQQKIFDVAWSGNRSIGADGDLPAVGNTVDTATAEYTNDIGAPQLAVAWTDPDFAAEQIAFYYVRLLEIPTPRHSLYDAVALGIDVSVTNQPATIQERAYSSPIWYTP